MGRGAASRYPGQKLFSGLGLPEAHRQQCLYHQHLRIEAHGQDSSHRIREMEGSCLCHWQECLCHWLPDLVFVAQPFLAVLPQATTQHG